MNYEAQTVIQNELDSGERLFWAGKPKQGFFLTKSDTFLIPFSLLWGGFAFYWEISVLSNLKKSDGPVGLLFPLFGIPFVLAGLYLVFGRFIYAALRRSKTYYGLTDQRVILVHGIISKNIKSLALNLLSDVSLTEKKNGEGTIAFGPENQTAASFSGNGWPGAEMNSAPRFEYIENAKQVYNTLRELQKR